VTGLDCSFNSITIHSITQDCQLAG
jgi:hypothetical protein